MSGSRPVRRLPRRGASTRPGRPAEDASLLLESAGPDLGLLFALVSLISLGVIMGYSAISVNVADPGDVLTKLVVFLVIGSVGMLSGIYLPVRSFWRSVSPWLLVVCAAMLLSLLVDANPMAITANGATRWLQLPGGFRIQPSEFTKLAFVLFAARFLARRGERMQAADWLAFLAVLGGLCGMIYLEPDLGTALVLGGTAFCMLIVAGADLRVLLTGLAFVAAVVFLLAWNTPHQQERLRSWWSPWEFRQGAGYQVIQSWAAMARGGLTGVGLGRSTYKLGDRLPESETDFIFAIVAEEMGLLRASGVLFLFGLLAWRGYRIAARAPDRYTSLLATGIISWISVQAVLNIAVVTGTVPNTGVPLPFISTGGSSLVALMTASGLVLGISRLRRPVRR